MYKDNLCTFCEIKTSSSILVFINVSAAENFILACNHVLKDMRFLPSGPFPFSFPSFLLPSLPPFLRSRYTAARDPGVIIPENFRKDMRFGTFWRHILIYLFPARCYNFDTVHYSQCPNHTSNQPPPRAQSHVKS